jgi:hypothetical protein
MRLGIGALYAQSRQQVALRHWCPEQMLDDPWRQADSARKEARAASFFVR